ncbi:MAG TPA: DUF2283 domain-containing protein [Planctomycetaceae bacterium]|jgi:uncharacterized protein YuzE|nr:DUF2283 domain-containing protein [Planctomycetaceae bacterium]
MASPFSFGMSVEVDNRTGRILAVYFRVRKGKSAETKEFDRGKVFVDYNSRGELLGIEMLAPSTIAVLDRVTSNEPQSRQFVRHSVPREMARS